MARTQITTQSVDADGLTVLFGAVDATASPDGNVFATGGGETVLVQNESESPITMTVDVPVTVDGVAVADRVITVPANSIVAWRPKAVHRQADGTVRLNWSTATDVGVAVIA
ncbi:hypothetical protein [Actinophytocola sediminis]